MLRFVLGPGRELVPDLAGKLPGRGMWLSARADVLERALTRGAFIKAARGPVHASPDLRRADRGWPESGGSATIVGLRTARRAGGHRLSGRCANGFRPGRAALLVEAADGSAAERARLLGRQ